MCLIDDEWESSTKPVWKNEYFLPKSFLVFKTKDGTIYDEKLGVCYELYHEDYDFICYGPKTMGQKHRDAMKRKPNFMFSSFDLKLSPFGWSEKQWSIEPKFLDNSSPSPAFELEPGKEIDVLVTLFYFSKVSGSLGGKGEQMGSPKSIKCVIGPGRPVSVKLVVSNNKQGDKTITITNGSNSLKGKGLNYSMNLFTLLLLYYPTRPSTHPRIHPLISPINSSSLYTLSIL